LAQVMTVDNDSSDSSTREHQPSLFSTAELKGCYSVTPAAGSKITPAALAQWKHRIWQFQQQVQQEPAQPSLFGCEADQTSPSQQSDQIDPFSLPRQNTEFWRAKADDAGVAALYFVIDYDLPILLYVGETVKSNQRWKGEHDCKRYLLNYRQVHYQHGLSSTLGIGFWPKAPHQTRPRQALELALIQKWRAPFNKENWRFWGTPFVTEV
jgi:hypothetical protein